MDQHRRSLTRSSLGERPARGGYLAGMRYQQCLMAAALVSMLAPGCRKDKDSTPPSVRILAPGAGFQVSIPDTFTVGVAVSDDRSVESITVFVADADGVPIAPVVVMSLGSASAELDVDLAVTDERIASGQYFITVRASDGVHDARAFQAITVHAAPLRVRSTFLIPPGSGAPPFTISRIDSTGGVSVFAAVQQLGQAVIGLDHLFVSGTSSAPLNRVRISTGSVESIMANPGSWSAYFTCLARDPDDGRIYACGADGAVKGFTTDGATTLSAVLPAGYHGEAMAVVGNSVVCAAVEPVSQQRKVFRLGYSSGAVLGQVNAPSRAVAMFAVDDDRVLVFGNSAADGVVHELSLGSGGSVQLRAFNTDALRCVERASTGVFILGLASGVHRFDQQTAAATSIIPGLVVDGLTFDPVSGTTHAAGGSTITVFNTMTGAVLNTQAAPHAAAKVLFQTNR